MKSKKSRLVALTKSRGYLTKFSEVLGGGQTGPAQYALGLWASLVPTCIGLCSLGRELIYSALV